MYNIENLEIDNLNLKPWSGRLCVYNKYTCMQFPMASLWKHEYINKEFNL